MLRSSGRASERDSSRKKIHLQVSELVDTNMCCVCYVLYSEGVSGEEWIECGCGRWLHEECAEDCYVDNSGKERFCPVCL